MGVVVSAHAIERFQARFPEEAAQHRNVADAIFAEVSQALAAGRRSVKEPRWLVGAAGLRRRSGGQKANRIVWTADQRRAYALVRGRAKGDEHRGETWVVKTTLRPREEKKL